jgi:hypothetical protein
MTFGILEGWYLQTPIAPEWILDLREIANALIESLGRGEDSLGVLSG